MPDFGMTPADTLERFFGRVEASISGSTFVKLVLSKPQAAEALGTRLAVRCIALKGQPQLCFVTSHATRDDTKNLSLPEGLLALRDAAAHAFHHAHLLTTVDEVQLLTSKKGKRSLTTHVVHHGDAQSAQATGAQASGHDRVKQRFIEQNRAWLTALGVTDAQHQVVPAMSRKWKQINKFVEVFAGALAKANLPAEQTVSVADFGSGKGYLTFAVHDYLTHTLQRTADVLGVELRADMVNLCNAAAARLNLNGLRFEEGDVSRSVPQKLDVMIALHACDTATDHAIHVGVRSGAAVILCSPCCHKQLRPQLMSPHPLQPLLQHGVHAGQQAEMLTDGLRAMLLEACGYDAQVFEFVALEHTQKNKMILAVKRAVPVENTTVLNQVRELKSFYGIRDQCLETLLTQSGLLAKVRTQPGSLKPI